ncbi:MULTISPECIES: hypothetical protein [Pseudonocardia]|uniref:PE family protein n=2 Tax=Pseudonocardia TaxID=1847 RepID=A0A1Y2N7M8_PSEAH|nr:MULTISPECIES: hypothetical protein [Pseudonocardia]OSY43463.1 hypothetical protein BG845_00406 [Pseudonocardia autotrophica]TDN73543.1 hypothetical protein C8E95_2643 [Pseudonocardia autotrophica]BBG04286.1 hypothetical protein Pdca_54950 [Pseudonocardia autotrophica]GEC25571.1 hypothetical protein PSA01_26000 [Pseudonocardia saturnea]
MTQINITNVLQARAALMEQVDSIQFALNNASLDLTAIPRCGDDPVSRDAQKIFQAKINHILDTHGAYLVELYEACARLDEAAVQYGLVEGDNTESFR